MKPKRHIAPQFEFGFVTENGNSHPPVNHPNPSKNGSKWVAYTDGSCLKNPGGPGGWAFVLYRDGKPHNPNCLTSDHLPETSNNRAELIAVIHALKAVPEKSHIEIISDSRYVVNGANHWHRAWARRGWRNVKNLELWKELIDLKEKRQCKMTWIRGHDGNPQNELCDRMAGRAAERLVV